MFFVLSGFLITFLLLKETQSAGSFSIRKFYKKRILRICPLFFATVALAFIFLPLIQQSHIFKIPDQLAFAISQTSVDFWAKLGLYCFFLPNLSHFIFTPVYCASHCWSIGVEAQFYALYPWLLKVFKRAPMFALLILGSTKFIGLKALEEIGRQIPWNNTFTVIHNVLEVLDFESFAIGGIAAYIMYKFPKRVMVFKHPLVLPAIITMISVGILFQFQYQNWFMKTAFAFLILTTALDTSTSHFRKSLRYLGKISYGIYMCHPICIFGAVIVCANLGLSKTITASCFVYLFSLAATLLVSALSYKYFESTFLQLKKAV